MNNLHKKYDINDLLWVVIFMNISKGLAVVVSILFFFELVLLFLGIFLSIFPGFSFSDNSIIRIICLLILIYVTKVFYNYLRGESSEDSNYEIDQHSGDDYRKIAIALVCGVFIIMIFVLIIFSI